MKSSPDQQPKFTLFGIERLHAPHVGGHQAHGGVEDAPIEGVQVALGNEQGAYFLQLQRLVRSRVNSFAFSKHPAVRGCCRVVCSRFRLVLGVSSVLVAHRCYSNHGGYSALALAPFPADDYCIVWHRSQSCDATLNQRISVPTLEPMSTLDGSVSCSLFRDSSPTTYHWAKGSGSFAPRCFPTECSRWSWARSSTQNGHYEVMSQSRGGGRRVP